MNDLPRGSLAKVTNVHNLPIPTSILDCLLSSRVTGNSRVAVCGKDVLIH